MARQRTRPDGRATFESRYGFYLRQLKSEHFPDGEPTSTAAARLELCALICARIERLRLELFDKITDENDAKLIALTRSLMSVTKQLPKKNAEQSPNIDEFMEDIDDDEADQASA